MQGANPSTCGAPRSTKERLRGLFACSLPILSLLDDLRRISDRAKLIESYSAYIKFTCSPARIMLKVVRGDCEKYDKTVKGSDQGVQCDWCDKWYHIKCCDMPEETYKAIEKTSSLKWF